MANNGDARSLDYSSCHGKSAGSRRLLRVERLFLCTITSMSRIGIDLFAAEGWGWMEVGCAIRGSKEVTWVASKELSFNYCSWGILGYYVYPLW